MVLKEGAWNDVLCSSCSVQPRDQVILEKKKSKAMQCDKKEKHRFEVYVVGKG